MLAISEQLRKYRTERGMTQEELAKEQTEVTKTDFDHFLYNPNTGEYEKHRSQKITNLYEFVARFWPLILILFWGLSYLIYSIIKLFV